MPDKKLTVLVTGATGFLGSHICASLQKSQQINLIAACRELAKLPESLQANARVGDLRDPSYRKTLTQDVNVICHAGTWSSMWNHRQAEKDYFLQPTLDLIQQAKLAGVSRFIMTSTVVMSKAGQQRPIGDFAETQKTGFWPHLDCLIDVDNFMQQQASTSMKMITMRLGHFIGAGNKLGIVPVLLPRLKTYMVPWLASGKSRMSLISGSDMGNAFAHAVQVAADKLNPYESFNIVGNSFPTSREVFLYLCEKSGSPRPLYSVPFFIGHSFAWLMEKLFPVLPGKAPFLTRSIVHLAKDWYCQSDYAEQKLGFKAMESWQHAIDDALLELEQQDSAWPSLMQKI